ncbi:acyltransferase domain-containing protein [Nocardia panacis]|uniref:Acyltransferase domain-containing protein n=1 Tax=Nocardia panacis TaxID=2340916 RepID=A0A3A4KQB4_9NOCA|nr:nocobactin polyketide synthase NbtC [Nocardia panacis]RJO72047.1 acyltransferase domain-containing protein [Nocardia panacis]
MSEHRMPDGTIPVLVSSDTAPGLRAEATALLSYLDRYPDTAPDRVADMLFRTRVARRRRALAMVRTGAELRAALKAIAEDDIHPAVVVGTAAPRRTGFVFPGQGSQRPGMGRLYYELSVDYQVEVDACTAIHVDRFGHAKPLHYLLGDEGEYEDAVWEVQPALMFHMAGLAAMWQAFGVRPRATVGHSQGELAAAAVSAVMTRRDAVLAVTHRARLVERIAPRGYSMAVLGTDRDECEQLLARHSGWAELSVINAPHILAVSGDRATIIDLVAQATARGTFAKEIRVAYPAHTSIVAELREDFERMLGDEMSSQTFTAGEIPCYGATLGAAITTDLSHRAYWYWNLRNRVRFDRAIVAATADVDTFIEVAEHPTLQLAVQENLTMVPEDPAGPRDFQVLGTSRRTATDLTEFTRSLAAVATTDQHYPWDALCTGDTRSTPPLPNFPHTRMNPKRLWAGPTSSPIAPEPARLAPARLVETWPRLARRTMTAPRTVAVVDRDGRCAEMSAALIDRASRFGASVSLWDNGSVATGAGFPADTVVVLLPASSAGDDIDVVGEFADFASNMSWLAALQPGITECWLVTLGAEAVLDNEVPASSAAAAAAAFRCVALEHLGIRFRHLDLSNTGAARSAADRVLEAVHLPDEPELAVRDGKLHVKRLAVVGASAADTPSVDATEVLLLGGTGQVGLEFCTELAHGGARRITLVNRRGETPELAARLRTLRALGTAEIEVIACDIADAGAVADLSARYAGRPVTLLVHAAVDYTYSAATDSDAAAIAASVGAKVLGLGRVLDAVPMTDTARVLLCSSFAATLGGWGQGLYAGANRMLDAVAARLRAAGRDCASVQWGLWELPAQADAAVIARIEGSGLLPMDPGTAVATGLASGSTNSLVLSADWARLHSVAETVGLGAVFAQTLENLGADTASGSVGGGAPIGRRMGVAPVERAEPDAMAASTSGSSRKPGDSTSARAELSLPERIRRELHRVILADGAESIDGSVPLVSLGMDSLQALDLSKRLEAELDRELPVAAILGGASLDDVVVLMSGTK